MSLSIFLSFLMYAFVISYTPGPANLLALNVSSQYGFKSYLKVLTGLYSGFVIDMVCCSILILGFSNLLPMFTKWLTYIGAVYILWLAWHIFSSVPDHEELKKNEKKPSFLTGFFLNLTNVKIILYGFTVYQMYVLPYYHTLPVIFIWAFIIAAIGASSTVVWALGGRLFSKVLVKHYKIFNTIMALLLVWCVIELLCK